MEFVTKNGCLERVIFKDGEGDNCDIIIPDGVKVIEKKVFSRTKIRSVVMPDTVEHIGESAFHACNKLEKIVFSANLESIGEYAFADCGALKEIRLPATLRYIDNYAFSLCFSLEKADIPSAGIIGIGAFSCCAIKELCLPDNLTQLEKLCFSFNDELTHVVFNSRMLELPFGAFSRCTKLQNITFPKQLKIINEQAFGVCDSLERIEIPSGVTKIKSLAFRDCHQLREVIFDDELEFIGDGAFSFCESLEEICIPSSVNTIEDRVFSECRSLKSIRLPHNWQDPYPSVYVEDCEDFTYYTPNIPATAHDDKMVCFAVRGFVHMKINGEKIDEKIAQSYIEFISNNLDELLIRFWNDTVFVEYLLYMIKPTKEVIDKTIEELAGNVEIVAILLKYKNDNGMTGDDYNI